MVLLNQMQDSNNKALNLSYITEEDELHAMLGIRFSKRKNKMTLGQNRLLEQIWSHTLNSSRIQLQKWYHLVDSQIILGAVQ